MIAGYCLLITLLFVPLYSFSMDQEGQQPTIGEQLVQSQEQFWQVCKYHSYLQKIIKHFKFDTSKAFHAFAENTTDDVHNYAAIIAQINHLYELAHSNCYPPCLANQQKCRQYLEVITTKMNSLITTMAEDLKMSAPLLQQRINDEKKRLEEMSESIKKSQEFLNDSNKPTTSPAQRLQAKL